MTDATPRTIVITGASSGIGKATARLFLDKGWNVVATMRNPAAEKDLKESTRLKLLALDLQDPEGPKAAVVEAIKADGRIDVWLNNAGGAVVRTGDVWNQGQSDRARRNQD